MTFNLCPLYLCRCAILEFKSGQEAASCVEGNKDVEVGDHKIKLSHCYPMPDHGQSSLWFSACSIYILEFIVYQYRFKSFIQVPVPHGNKKCLNREFFHRRYTCTCLKGEKRNCTVMAIFFFSSSELF